MKLFFRRALLLPFAVGALGLLLGQIWPDAFALAAPLIFGGVPYLPLAILLWYLIGRCQTKAQLVALAVAAPVLFVPVMFLFTSLLGHSPMSGEDHFTDLGFFVAATLVWGYAFVALAWILFLVLSGAKVGSSAL